jgi:hypothetical protein
MRFTCTTLFAVLATGLCGTAAAAELSAADHTAIQQLHARYNTTIDRGDAERPRSRNSPCLRCARARNPARDA